MKKRVLSMAAIWLALAALVLIYTDAEEYTWRLEGDALEALLLTEEQAQQAELEAEAAMDAEKREAQARAEAGEWGKADEYGGAPQTLPALDDTPGLNLMWGDYEVEVAYSAPEPFGLRVVSAGRQPFIVNGEEEAGAAPQGGVCRFLFTLTDSTQRVRLACTLPEGAEIDAVTVRKAGTGVFSRDLAAYALLVGIVLTVLLVLSWDERAVGCARRRDALVLVCAALFAGMPLLWGGLYDGHDLFFHLNRIEGIASALRAGQFPVRIHASTLLGYGYAAPEFYPELFLYIPAVMRNLGVSLLACMRVFEMGIHLLAAMTCYISARRLFSSRRVALGASVLYTLCVYRLVNMYVRATIGESLAMIFFPLLILAMAEVLTGDERRWPLLALAMTGIFMSHLLSTMFAVLFCAAAAIACLPRLIRRPRRILACVKAAGVMLLCSLWFLVPMLEYTKAGVSTSVVLHAADYVLHLGSYLVGFAGNMGRLSEAEEDFAYTIGVVPGLSILLGCALLLVRLYMRGRAARSGEDERRDRLSLALLALGAAALLLATDAFPWSWACSLRRPFSTLFMQIQFPWRLVGVASPMLCMAAAWGYLREERQRTAGLAVIVALSVIFSGYTLQCFVQQQSVLAQDGYCDTRIEQYEYTYAGTEKSALAPGDITVQGEQEIPVSGYEKRGTNLSFTLTMAGGCEYVEVPLLYYPGYRAQADGVECRVAQGTNNLVRLYGVYGEGDVRVRVWFEPPMTWIAAQAASAAGAALLLFLLVRKRRGA